MLSIGSKILPTKGIVYLLNLILKSFTLQQRSTSNLYNSITQQELDVILHARKSLFSKNKPWEKTINEPLFDIAMGSYDGAEICELVGLYMLSFLGKVYWIQNVGLRENSSLKITITTNLKTVNFLDVTFNLCTRKYQPYNKPNDTPTYINVNSNHPPNIIKALPNSI